MKRKIEEALLAWKKKENRLPLLVNGARQVGKTYSLREFGRKAYESVVYINLETNRRAAACFEEDLSPYKLLPYLEAVMGQRILRAACWEWR